MKLMIDGIWKGDVAQASAVDMINAGAFRHRVTPDGSSDYAAAPDRYHLFVSYACPFSHRVITTRALKRLEHIVGMSVLHPQWDTSDGWVFAATNWSTPDGSGCGFLRLHEAFSASRRDYTGKVTVPVIWDRLSRRIVNNESGEIVQMLNGAFDEFCPSGVIDLYPTVLRPQIDGLGAEIEANLAKAVYRVAGAVDQEQYDLATANLFGFLDDLEVRLRDGRRFLFGGQVTTADILVFATLVRFDAVYNPLFRATRKRLVDYPLTSRLVFRIYSLPGVADTVRLDHILMHYYDGDWAVAARRGIVPDPPTIDFRVDRFGA